MSHESWWAKSCILRASCHESWVLSHEAWAGHCLPRCPAQRRRSNNVESPQYLRAQEVAWSVGSALHAGYGILYGVFCHFFYYKSRLSISTKSIAELSWKNKSRYVKLSCRRCCRCCCAGSLRCSRTWRLVSFSLSATAAIRTWVWSDTSCQSNPTTFSILGNGIFSLSSFVSEWAGPCGHVKVNVHVIFMSASIKVFVLIMIWLDVCYDTFVDLTLTFVTRDCGNIRISLTAEFEQPPTLRSLNLDQTTLYWQLTSSFSAAYGYDM